MPRTKNAARKFCVLLRKRYFLFSRVDSEKRIYGKKKNESSFFWLFRCCRSSGPSFDSSMLYLRSISYASSLCAPEKEEEGRERESMSRMCSRSSLGFHLKRWCRFGRLFRFYACSFIPSCQRPPLSAASQTFQLQSWAGRVSAIVEKKKRKLFVVVRRMDAMSLFRQAPTNDPICLFLYRFSQQSSCGCRHRLCISVGLKSALRSCADGSELAKKYLSSLGVDFPTAFRCTSWCTCVVMISSGAA